MDIDSIDVMLAQNHPAFTREGWIFELKWYDGYRMLASPKKTRSREGTDATHRYPEVLRELRALKRDFILDGETCTLDDEGKPDFEAMRRARRRFTYFAFDLLELDGKDLRALPLLERKKRLRKLLPPDTFALRYVDHIETDGERMFAYALAQHLEGVVAKKADSKYVGGRNES